VSRIPRQDIAAKPDGTPSSAPRRGRPPHDTGKRRQRILDAASTLFLERGFAATTIDAVSGLAGVTKRTIYEAVGDKVALFRTVCGENSSSTASVIWPVLSAGTNLTEALTDLTHALLDYAATPTRIAVSRMIALESMRFPELSREVLEAGRSSVHDGIISVFRQLEDFGLVRFSDHALAAAIFYDVMVGNLGYRATLGFGYESMSVAEIEKRLTTFIQGYVRSDEITI